MRIWKEIVVSVCSLFAGRLSTLSILMYHSVSDSGAFFSVTPHDFEEHMRYLKERGYETIFASDISDLSLGASANTVCITFDDGYEDVYTEAFPILKRFSIKVSIFLITSEIGGSYTTSEGRTFKLLSEAQIREMQESGLVEFMPHGHTHKKLHTVSDRERESEIRLSTETIETLTGSRPSVFAYPRGRTTPEVVRELQKYGYTRALGVIPGLVRATSERYNLPRNAVDRNVSFSEFKLKISDALDTYLALTRLFRS